jgi:hypothetical protein
VTLEYVADSLLGDVPDLKHQKSCFVEYSTPSNDGDNDREDEDSRTHPDRLVLGPSGE